MARLLGEKCRRVARSSRRNAPKQGRGSRGCDKPPATAKRNGEKHSQKLGVPENAGLHDRCDLVVSTSKTERGSSLSHTIRPFRLDRGKERSPKTNAGEAAPPSPLLKAVHRPSNTTAQQLLYVHEFHAVSIPIPRIKHIIQRLDSSFALQHAANAIVSVANGRMHSRSAAQRRQPALSEYMKAMSEVNSSSEVTEPLLLAISLFWYMETDCGTEAGEKFHTRGFHSLILADPAKWARNPVGWTILLATRPAATEAYMAVGKPSPFEDDSWFNPDIPPQDCARAGILTKLAHQILFKIPRLSMLMRKVRSGVFDLFAICETTALAHRILGIRDDALYRSILDKCERRDTESHIDQKVAPKSLHFKVLDEQDWFIDYSRARLTIVTLCLALQRFIWRYQVPQVEKLRKEQQELVNNILSCWEQCMENQRFPRAMRPAVIPLYGALKQMQSDDRPFVDEALSWLNFRSVLAFANVEDFNGEEHLSATWELYCGGPAAGTLYRHWAD